jgi:hypothetical protein
LNETLFEVLFMMVILKIPILYLCGVVWYAWRAEPRPPEPVAGVPAVPEPQPYTPAGLRRMFRRGPRRGGPHGAPPRRGPRREAVARGRVRP